MFRFTIRELVLVTAVVALVLGWCLDHRQATSRRENLELDFAQLKAQLTRQSQYAWNLTRQRDKLRDQLQEPRDRTASIEECP